MSKIRSIIFDYDGIISESVNVKTYAFAEIYSEYGVDIVDKVINHHNNNGGVSRFEKFKYYHKEFLKINLKSNEINFLASKFSKLVLEKVISSDYVEGVYDFIKENYNKYMFFISTGTPENEIKLILKRKKIDNFFIEVFGSPQNKNIHVKNILEKYNLKKNETVFIGDALSDQNAAKINGINFIGRYTTDPKIKNSKFLIKNFLNFHSLLKEIE